MFSVKSRFALATACAALAASLVAAGPAGASPAKHVNATTSRSSAHLTGPGVHANTPTTAYGAGFFSYPGAGNVSAASATFTMPSISCKRSTDQEWLSPGVWVYDDTGTLSQFSGVEFNCNFGSTFMGDVICVDSYSACDDTLVVSPGDRVEASLSESSTSTTATVRDLTTATSVQVVGAAVSNDRTVFLGDEGPSLANSGVTHVPTFTKVVYSKAQVNGQYVGDWSPVRYNLATTGSTVQEKASALTGDGDAFTTTFQHN